MEQPPKKTERVERLNEMPEEWQALRAKILNNFESKNDGLDIERVKEFMKERGLPVLDFIFYEDKDIPRLQKLLSFTHTIDPELEGEYVPNLNLILMKRGKDVDETGRSFYDEGNLVHELSHGVNECASYVKKEKDPVIRKQRTGFAFTHQGYGWFLEEGFADMMKGEYNKSFCPIRYREKILEKFKVPLNASLDTMLTLHGYQSSIKYFILQKSGNLGTSPSSAASTGIEMLCEKIPELRQTLIEARSDIEKLREIPKLINSIEPGLYMKIQQCDYSEEEFARVQNIIKEAIENSK
jgi:hypothetical protein